MYDSETMANTILNKAYKEYGYLSGTQYIDFFFGPFAWKNTPEVHKEIWKKFDKKMPSFGTNNYGVGEYLNQMVTYMPLSNALTSGLSVRTVEVPFLYPELQKENEEAREVLNLKFDQLRRKQRIGLITQRLIHLVDENRVE